MKPLFYLIVALSFSIIHAQTTDSLLNVFNSQTNDSNKVNALNALFMEHRYSDESLANQYINQAKNFAAKTDFTKGYAQALYNKGVFEGEHGNFDSSDFYLNLAIVQYKKINNLSGIASCKMAFGFNMYDKADFRRALEYFLESAKAKETIGDLKGLAGANIWIGNVYNNGLFKPKMALPYYEKALLLQQKLNDEKGMGYTYNNIGNVYYFLQQYPDALKNHLKSAEIKEKYNDQKGLGSSYDNIGNIYFDTQNYLKAEQYYQKALLIRETFGDKKGITTSYVNIGNLYLKQKKYKNAISSHSKALEYAQNIDNKEAMRESSNSLAACYEAIGDYKKAFEYHKYSSRINDSIINNDFTQQISEMQTKYDVEKKDLEISNQKTELELKDKQNLVKNIIIISIASLLILLTIVTVLIFRKKKIEQQAKLDAALAHQKEERNKAVIEAEEKERKRIAQDLHDGVGQLLSAAKLNLSHLETQLHLKNEEELSAMQNAINLVDDSVKEVRNVSHSMMPNTLIKLGLVSAIREFISKLGNAPHLKIDLEIVGLNNRLDSNVETILYRVIQEIVNNIIKHAKASQISMQLVKHESELNIMIEDNGVGFDTTLIESFDGIGLKGIQSRIDFLNGTVHFDSTLGKGTTVIIDIPLS